MRGNDTVECDRVITGVTTGGMGELSLSLLEGHRSFLGIYIYIYHGSMFSFDMLLVENGYLLCSPSRNYPSYVKMQLFERFYVTAESCPEGSVIVSKCAVQTLYHGYASRPDRWFLRCTAVQNRILPHSRKAQNGFYDISNK